MSNSSFLYQIGSPQVCLGDVHVYPTIYAGDPEYAEEFFSHCICGAKKKITTVTEVDVAPKRAGGGK